MKTLLKIAAASLALAGMTALATPAIAGPGHVELRVQTGYYSPPVYVQPRVIYEAPAPMYRYRDDAAWRERERREHHWRERNAWREHQWREHHDRERWGAWR
jgi:hypothetical protein